MMAKQHATMGAAAWLLVATPQPIGLGIAEVSALGIVAGTVMSMGAALLPDLDHHSSTSTRTLPPFTRWGISKFIAKLSGGHRNGTHSIFGILAFGLIALFASLIAVEIEGATVQIGSALVAMFLSVLGLHSLKIKGIVAWLISAVIGLVMSVALQGDLMWLPMVVIFGAFIHSLGDYLTVAGINWIYPFVWKPLVPSKYWTASGRMALPIFGTTGTPTIRMTLFMAANNIYITLALIVAIVATINSGLDILSPINPDAVSEAFTKITSMFSEVR